MTAPTCNTPLLPGSLKNLFFPPEKNEYTYFARAATHPFNDIGSGLKLSRDREGAVQNSIVKAAWAADAAMLAYARYGPQRMSAADLATNLARGGLTFENEIGDWNAPGTQGYFAANDQFAFISFRGTEPDDPFDQFDDAELSLMVEPDFRPAPENPAPALGPLSLVEHLFATPCFVHRGFQRALNRVWPQVHSIVTNYRNAHPQAEICFTGHSLGAALAVLAFSRFPAANNSLITFGCPRAGDKAFGDRVLSQTGKGIVRYVNLNDSVTHVPLEGFLYRHAPQECLRFDANGNLDGDDGSFKGDAAALAVAVKGLHWDLSTDLSKVPAPDGLVDHSPARYCIRLWNCVS
jgi:triacylglycerol lipase